MEEQAEYNAEENDSQEESLDMDRIQALADVLLKKRDVAVEYRAASGIERKWSEDERLFDGIDGNETPSMLSYATGESFLPVQEGPQRSTVVVNIIRGKCETAEGRFSDIQLPVDDRNWGLKVTPVATIVKGLKDNRPAKMKETGQPLRNKQTKEPVKVSDVARMDQEAAKEKMKAMETEIDDQLTECDYNGESRKVIRSAVRAGTGIIKGPNVVKSTRKAWVPQQEGDQEVQVLEIQEEMKPASKWVDKWNVYPDPDVGEDIKRAGYIWEKDTILPRELRDLLGVDGYFDEQIIKILQEEPVRTVAEYEKKTDKLKARSATTVLSSQYQKWEYYGDLNREDLEAFGVDITHDMISQSFSACVVFVNNRPIKALLNTLDTGDMPYDFFTWTTVTDSPWGMGYPRTLMWLQRMMTAAWRTLMDNMGDSSGANLVVGPGVQPDDGVWEITGKKIWRLLEDDIDVQKVFNQFQLINNQESIQAVIDLITKFIDIETSLPMLFQGEKAEAPETLGATNIMVDANNVTLRGRVKLYDDQITRPHLKRYYHWNMQYNPKAEIKGDFNVDARGTSVLLERDQQAQTLIQILAAKNDPDINMIVDWEKASKQLFKALKLDILKSDEDYAAAKEALKKQPKPQDPRIESTKMKVQGDMQKAQLVQKSDMAEITAKSQATQSEIQAKAQDAELERQNKLELERMRMNTKMMELSQSQGISLAQIKADLMGVTMKLKTQVALTDKEGKAPGGIATPIVEPVGKAPDGESYTK